MVVVDKSDVKIITTKNYQSSIKKRGLNSIIIHREHVYDESKLEIDIHGAYWSLGIFYFPIHAGALRLGEETINLIGKKILFIPPFSVLHWLIKPSKLSWTYLIVKEKMNKKTFTVPKLFDENTLNMEVCDLYDLDSDAILSLIEAKYKCGQSLAWPVKNCSEKVKYAIDSCFAENLQLKTILFSVNPSLSYLSRQFSKDYGLSPIQYRQRLRLMQASVDCMFNRKSVESIHLDLGFDDSSYFYQSFRDYLHTSPSEFRKVSKCF